MHLIQFHESENEKENETEEAKDKKEGDVINKNKLSNLSTSKSLQTSNIMAPMDQMFLRSRSTNSRIPLAVRNEKSQNPLTKP